MVRLALVTLALTAAIVVPAAAEDLSGGAPNAPVSAAAAAPQTAPQPANVADETDPSKRLVFDDTPAAQTPSAPAIPGYGGDVIRLVLSLGAVLAVVALAVWGFRRFAPRTASMFASENLKVIARTYLGPKQAIYLVRAPGSLLVVAATQESVSLLSEVKDPVEIERVLGVAQSTSPKSASQTFKTILSGVTGSAARDNDAETAQDLEAAVRSVSDRFARLNRKLETLEQQTD